MTSEYQLRPEHTETVDSSEKQATHNEMTSTAHLPPTRVDHNMGNLKAESEIASDTEGGDGEKATREKLKKASINSLPKHPALGMGSEERVDEIMISRQADIVEMDEHAEHSNSEDERGRPTRKRSYDDLQAGEGSQEMIDSPSTHHDHGHARKKSREAPFSQDTQETARIRSVSRSGSVEDDKDERVQDDSPVHEDKAELSTAVQDTPLEEGHPIGEEHGGPKKKRSRDQFVKDDKEVEPPEESNGFLTDPTGDAVTADEEPTLPGLSRKTTGEPDKKRHRDSSLENLLPRDQEGNAPKRLSTSGFGNTTAKSPFAALNNSTSIFKPTIKNGKEEPKQQPQTSSSAFAASGFAALSESENSPFGGLGSSGGNTKSVFGGFGGLGSSNPPLSSFGSATTTSTLGGTSSFVTTSQSGFGKLGGGGFGGAGGLKSFASSEGPSTFGSKPAKPFGAPTQEADESGDEEASEAGGDNEEHHEDERFHKQKIETGEEGEETIFSCKAKLLYNNGKEWKERGAGTFKLNVSEPPFENPDDETYKRTGRVVMRTEGVFRVILNAPLFKGMKVGNPPGKKPTGKMVYFTVIENGKPAPLVLKTGNAKYTEEFFNKIQELEEEL